MVVLTKTDLMFMILLERPRLLQDRTIFSAIAQGHLRGLTFTWNVFLSFARTFTDFRRRSTIGLMSVPPGIGVGILPLGPDGVQGIGRPVA